MCSLSLSLFHSLYIRLQLKTQSRAFLPLSPSLDGDRVTGSVQLDSPQLQGDAEVNRQGLAYPQEGIRKGLIWFRKQSNKM